MGGRAWLARIQEGSLGRIERGYESRQQNLASESDRVVVGLKPGCRDRV